MAKRLGPDGLNAEHLFHAHPAVAVHLCALFRSIILHGYVPNNFGSGIKEKIISFIHGLGRLDFTHIRMLLMYELICKSLQCHNYSLSVLARLSIMSKDFKNVC